jgi:hypothetical protein
MGYICSSSTYTVTAYLTNLGKQLYFNGEDSDIIASYFTLGDSDTNYIIASNNNPITTGFIPNVTGIVDQCINSVALGSDITYKLKSTPYQQGQIITQYCLPPYTLIQQISNGDGTSYYITTENSTSCGFTYKSNVFSQSFTKNSCVSGATGQSYNVSTTYGQFTGLTQDQADSLALNYLQVSGQTIANEYGNCLFGNTLQTMIFTPNNCPNGGRPYTVSALTNTFFSTISTADANNNALIYLTTNGQTIANTNGQCKVLIGTETIYVTKPGGITVPELINIYQ